MVARVAGWLLLGGLYAAAGLTLDPFEPAVQEPRLLEWLERDTRTAALALCAAAAFALSAVVAREWVPDPWASRTVLATALSPAGFALAAGTAGPPAVLLAAGLLGALRTRDDPTRLRTLGGAACLAVAPWFGLAFAVPAAGGLLALVYWSYRRRRRLYAFLALEFGGASAVTLGGVEVSEAVGGAPGLDGVAAVLVGAPVLVLVLASLALLVRAWRERLARAIPAWHDAEVGIALAVLMVGATAAAAVVEPIGPEAAVPIAAAPAALAMRSFPRVGAALALIAVALTVWRVVALATGSADRWLIAL